MTKLVYPSITENRLNRPLNDLGPDENIEVMNRAITQGAKFIALAILSKAEAYGILSEKDLDNSQRHSLNGEEESLEIQLTHNVYNLVKIESELIGILLDPDSKREDINWGLVNEQYPDLKGELISVFSRGGREGTKWDWE